MDYVMKFFARNNIEISIKWDNVLDMYLIKATRNPGYTFTRYSYEPQNINDELISLMEEFKKHGFQ